MSASFSSWSRAHRGRSQVRAAGRRGAALPIIGIALVLAVGGAAGASPLISEVFYDAVGSDDGQSFVELYGEPGTSLDGFTLEGVNGFNGAVGPVIVLGGVIPPSGLYATAATGPHQVERLPRRERNWQGRKRPKGARSEPEASEVNEIR